MTMLRRAPQQLYRVYSAEEFADAGMLTAWDGSPAREASRERRFRRLAGAAALTGAVGTVGGAIAFASVGPRSTALQTAASAVPRVRAAGLPLSPAPRPDAVQRARAGRVVLMHEDARTRASRAGTRAVARPQRRHPRSGRSRSRRRGELGSHIAAGQSAEHSPPPAARIVEDAAATAVMSAPSASAETRPQPPTQGEFGFER